MIKSKKSSKKATVKAFGIIAIIVALITTTYVSFNSSVYAHTPELVINGGFEQGLNSVWYTANDGGGASIDTAIKYSGNQGLKLQGASGVDRYIYNPAGGYTPQLTIDPTKSYELSMYVKTDSISTGKFYVQVLDFDSSNNVLGYEYYDVGGSRTSELLTATGTADWTKKTIYLHPIDSNLNGIRTNTHHIVIFLRIYDTTGSVWIDDVSLKVKDVIQITADANVAFNESSGDDIATMKDYLKQTGHNSGFPNLNDAMKSKLKDIGTNHMRLINAFNQSVTRDVYGDLVYDFTIAKNMVDDIITLGATPHLIIGSFTPQEMSIYPDDPYYYAYQPTDWTEFEDYIYQTIKFFNVTNNYNILHWEVGNEPDAGGGWYDTYPLGGQVKYDKYWELYKHAVNAVNKYEADYPAAPRIKVGGPAASCFSFNSEWVPFNWYQKILQDANAENVRMDFISIHAYHKYVGIGGIPQQDSLYGSFEQEITSIKGWRDTYKPNAEIMITEFGMGEGTRIEEGYVNGSNQAAANYIKFLLSSMRTNAIDEMLWLSSRDFPESGNFNWEPNTYNAIPGPGAANGWSWPSMFTSYDEVKAPYNAMKMLSMMADTRIKADMDTKDNEVEVIASKDNTKITGLMINHHWDYKNHHSESMERTANITINNVTSPLSSLKYVIYKVNENTSNAYYLYKHNMPIDGRAGLQIVAKGSISKTGNTVVMPSITLEQESAVLFVLNLDQDDTAPSVPNISTSSQSTDNLTIEISGTAESGARIEIENNNNLSGICHADSLGNWYENIKLSDGQNSIKAKAIDRHGNESQYSGDITVTKSANTVAAPVLSGSSTSSTTSYTLSGTAQVGTKITVYNNQPDLTRKVLAKEVAVDDSGNFSVGIKLEAGQENNISAQAYDTFGNLSSFTAKIINCTAIKNMIKNGGFDEGYQYWGLSKANGMINLNNVIYNDGYSLKWTGDNNRNFIFNPVDGLSLLIDNTKDYELSLYVKTTGVTSGGVYINVQDRNGSTVLGNEYYMINGVKTDKLLEANGTTDEFIQKTITLTPPQPDGTGRRANTDRIVILVNCDANTGGYAWVDSIFLKELP